MRLPTSAAALLAALFVSGCGQQNAEETAEPVGKYTIYHDAGVVGSIRLNTVTGETYMLITSDTELMHSGVTMNGKPLVWKKIATSTGR